MGSGCGSIGIGVASETRGPWFDSTHRQNFIFIQKKQIYSILKDINIFSRTEEANWSKDDSSAGPTLPKSPLDIQLNTTESGVSSADNFLTPDASVTSADSFNDSRCSADEQLVSCRSGPSADGYIVTCDSFLSQDEQMDMDDNGSGNKPGIETIKHFILTRIGAIKNVGPPLDCKISVVLNIISEVLTEMYFTWIDHNAD